MSSRCWADLSAYLGRAVIVGMAGWFGFCGFFWQSAPCSAHEVRPSYLELREDRVGEFDVLLKTPMRGELRLALAATFSGRADAVTPMTMRATGDAAVQTWRFRALDPLRGQTVGIAGLENTMTDALVRVAFLDGTSWVRRLTPQEAAVTIPLLQSGWPVAGLYLKLGVEHILLGIDHLLFVLALIIITRGTWPLIKTVTAFTLAHSVTLALATLGYVHVPSAPVEALIALSIAFVAVEIVRQWQGREGLTARAPWLVAFTFGLLHGLGFAGALSEIGLPEGQIPLALLFFNVGVEIGQLLFIATTLCVAALVWRVGRSVRPSWPRWTGLAAPYAIGSIAMFWMIQRVAAF
jgi:HupE / UreJ protein